MAGGEGLEAALLEKQDEARCKEGRRVLVIFFLMGAASDVTFNGVVLSVAYLVGELGTEVLLAIGRAQFLGSSGAMCALFAFALCRPSSVAENMSSQVRHLAAALAYMLCVNAGMALAALCGWPLNGSCLQLALLLNGVASGTAQSLLGVLSGLMTKFGGHPGTASAQVAGMSFGIALPTAAQLLLIPVALPLRCAAAINYCLALFVMLAGVVSLLAFRRTETFLDTRSLNEVTGRPQLKETLTERFAWYMARRFQHVALPSVGLLANFAALVYCNLLTPRLPGHGIIPPQQLLPTLLIGGSNAMDFAGRMLALRFLHVEPRSSLCALLQRSLEHHGLWLAVRLSAGAACLAFALGWQPVTLTSNAPLFGCYGLGAFCGGVATVSLTQHAQSICMRSSGLNMDAISALPCPLAGQVMMLACMLGSVAGALMPCP